MPASNMSHGAPEPSGSRAAPSRGQTWPSPDEAQYPTYTSSADRERERITEDWLNDTVKAAFSWQPPKYEPPGTARPTERLLEQQEDSHTVPSGPISHSAGPSTADSGANEDAELHEQARTIPGRKSKAKAKKPSNGTRRPAFYDMHFDEKLMLRDVQPYPDLVSDLLRNLDKLIEKRMSEGVELPTSTAGLTDAETMDLEFMSASGKHTNKENAIQELYALHTARYCLPVASTLLLHPTFPKWGKLIDWTTSVNVTASAISDGSLQVLKQPPGWLAPTTPQADRKGKGVARASGLSVAGTHAGPSHPVSTQHAIPPNRPPPRVRESYDEYYQRLWDDVEKNNPEYKTLLQHILFTHHEESRDLCTWEMKSLVVASEEFMARVYHHHSKPFKWEVCKMLNKHECAYWHKAARALIPASYIGQDVETRGLPPRERKWWVLPGAPDDPHSLTDTETDSESEPSQASTQVYWEENVELKLEYQPTYRRKVAYTAHLSHGTKSVRLDRSTHDPLDPTLFQDAFVLQEDYVPDDPVGPSTVGDGSIMGRAAALQVGEDARPAKSNLPTKGKMKARESYEPITEEERNDTDYEEGRNNVSPRWLLQQAWAQAVRADASVIVLHSGNHEYIGIRERERQILFLSPLIRPHEFYKYGKLHVALYVAAVQDAMERRKLNYQQGRSEMRPPNALKFQPLGRYGKGLNLAQAATAREKEIDEEMQKVVAAAEAAASGSAPSSAETERERSTTPRQEDFTPRRTRGAKAKGDDVEMEESEEGEEEEEEEQEETAHRGGRRNRRRDGSPDQGGPSGGGGTGGGGGGGSRKRKPDSDDDYEGGGGGGGGRSKKSRTKAPPATRGRGRGKGKGKGKGRGRGADDDDAPEDSGPRRPLTPVSPVARPRHRPGSSPQENTLRRTTRSTVKKYQNKVLRLLADVQTRHSFLLFLRYGIYDSAVPASFTRGAPSGSGLPPRPETDDLKVNLPPSKMGKGKQVELLDLKSKPREDFAIVLTAEIGKGLLGITHGGVLHVAVTDDQDAVSMKVSVKIATRRNTCPRLKAEHQVYAQLHDEKVRGIPTIIGFFEDKEDEAAALVTTDVGLPLGPDRQPTAVQSAAFLRILLSIHEAGFLHNDISPESLTIDEQGDVFIKDFHSASKTIRLEPKLAEEAKLRAILNGEWDW